MTRCRASQFAPIRVSGTWKGTKLTIDYPGELMERVTEPPQRPHAEGTLFFIDQHDSIEVPEDDPRAFWRVYNPRLDIMVMPP